MTKLVIYTDLGRSLPDHGSYSHAAAAAMLAELHAHGIPVIIAQRKIRFEQISLRTGISFIDQTGYSYSTVFNVC
jgi:predicted mannosyl-3-phosphoglycerate phosphatase (HAD superfamily)